MICKVLNRRAKQKRILLFLLGVVFISVFVQLINSSTSEVIEDNLLGAIPTAFSKQPSRHDVIDIALTAELSPRHPDILDRLVNITKSIYRQSNGGRFLFHIFTNLESNITSVFKSTLQKLNRRDSRVQGSARFYHIESIVKKHIDELARLIYYFWERSPEEQALWTRPFRVPVVFLRPLYYKFDELKDIDRIISLDSDMMFMNDIYELYSKFFEMNETQALGMAPEFVYCGQAFPIWNKKNPSSPIGKDKYTCVNGGLLLSNLKKLRTSEPYRYLMTEKGAHELTDKYRMITHLSEQDMVSLIRAEHPELFYDIECTWNYQLNAVYHVGSESRVPCDGPVHLYHGNSLQKFPLEVYKSIENM